MPGDVHFETFPERDDQGAPTGRVRWRLQDANGEITASSNDGFESRSHANDAITNVVGDICRMVVPGAESLTVRAADIVHVED